VAAAAEAGGSGWSGRRLGVVVLRGIVVFDVWVCSSSCGGPPVPGLADWRRRLVSVGGALAGGAALDGRGLVLEGMLGGVMADVAGIGGCFGCMASMASVAGGCCGRVVGLWLFFFFLFNFFFGLFLPFFLDVLVVVFYAHVVAPIELGRRRRWDLAATKTDDPGRLRLSPGIVWRFNLGVVILIVVVQGLVVVIIVVVVVVVVVIIIGKMVFGWTWRHVVVAVIVNVGMGVSVARGWGLVWRSAGRRSFSQAGAGAEVMGMLASRDLGGASTLSSAILVLGEIFGSQGDDGG
jgi:hypothetical protein